MANPEDETQKLPQTDPAPSFDPPPQAGTPETPPSEPKSSPQPDFTRQPASPYEGVSIEEDLDEDEESKAPLILAVLGLGIAIVALLMGLGIIPTKSDDTGDTTVGAEQIAEGAVSPDKLSPSLLSLLETLEGESESETMAKPGPRGPRGKPGPAGPPGFGEPTVITDTVVATARTSTVSALAVCPAGTTLISGGVSIKGAEDVAITGSAPDPDGRGWTGAAVETVPTNKKWKLNTFAVCSGENAGSANTQAGTKGDAKRPKKTPPSKPGANKGTAKGSTGQSDRPQTTKQGGGINPMPGQIEPAVVPDAPTRDR